MYSIREQIKESIRIKNEMMKQAEVIEGIAGMISASLKLGGKILICGNGGSASDSQHIAAEFVNKFRLDRKPMPAVSMTTDTSILTSISNDYGFGSIFEKQVEALGKRGDVLIAISTSGKSENIIRAIRAAKRKGMKTVALTGESGIREKTDICLKVPSKETPRIQEAHITALHIVCDLVEKSLFRKQ